MVVNADRTKVISYIDGFNLYFGLREQGWRKYMWLDVVKLSASVILPHCTLIQTKYFTSRVRGNVGKQERQTAFLDAIMALDDLSIYWGRYQPDWKKCHKCGHIGQHPQEKKTDVNIATQMICDAYCNAYDTALLMSGDSDLVPAVETVRKLFPAKKIVVAFPPKRYSSELAAHATSWLNIFEHKFKGCQMPHAITLPSGAAIKCPDKWK
jgi:uncharacterized LabA/DUF88 family protein